MVDLNNAATISQSAFKDILDPMSQHKLGTLTKKLHHGESGQARSLGIGMGAGVSMGRGGNDSMVISREIAQGWIDSGELMLDTNEERRKALGKNTVDHELIGLRLTRPIRQAQE